MNKLSYLDHLASKAHLLFLGIVVPMACRLIGQFLTPYYNDYLLLRPVIWFFSPIIDVNIYWTLLIVSAPCIALVSIEYIFKKITELVER